jgi:hypothetical protein
VSTKGCFCLNVLFIPMVDLFTVTHKESDSTNNFNKTPLTCFMAATIILIHTIFNDTTGSIPVRRYYQKNPPTELKNQTTHHVQTSSACTLVASFFTDSVSFGCSNKSKHCQKTCIVQHSGRRCGIEVLEYIMLWMHNRTGSNCNSCHFYPIC